MREALLDIAKDRPTGSAAGYDFALGVPAHWNGHVPASRHRAEHAPAAAVYTAPGAGALARERASKARFSPLRRIEGIGALIACAIVAEAAGNMVFHQIVLTQARIYQHAQQYLARRRAEGRTSRETRRALKRLIVRRVHRAWRACFESDVERVAA